jgi:hypothetical protein
MFNSQSSPTLTNCILWGNGEEIFNDETSTALVTYCDVQGGYGGVGNISLEPTFADPANGNFHLLQGSPCIDTGNNAAPFIPALDFEGEVRPWDGDGDTVAIADMGADELVPQPPTATTGAATAVGTSSATLNGTVNANYSSTTVTFEYGTDTSYGNAVTADQSPVTGSADTAVSKTLLGLSPKTTYHYRVVATNASGTTYGADMTFATEPGKPANGKAHGKDDAPGQNKEPGEPANGKDDAPGQNKEPGESANGKAYGKGNAPGQNK